VPSWAVRHHLDKQTSRSGQNGDYWVTLIIVADKCESDREPKFAYGYISGNTEYAGGEIDVCDRTKVLIYLMM
jgi:hypothetical protein